MTPDQLQKWHEDDAKNYAGFVTLSATHTAAAKCVADMRNRIAEIERENASLRSAAEFAAHNLEQARVWNGTDWHYNPLHPLHYRSALKRLRDALDAAIDQAREKG